MILFGKKVYYILIGIFLTGFLVIAYDTVNTGYIVNHGETKNVYDANNNCHKVTNHNPLKNYFVPTRTVEEWNSFNSNHPDDVDISDCVIYLYCKFASQDYYGSCPATSDVLNTMTNVCKNNFGSQYFSFAEYLYDYSLGTYGDFEEENNEWAAYFAGWADTNRYSIDYYFGSGGHYHVFRAHSCNNYECVPDYYGVSQYCPSFGLHSRIWCCREAKGPFLIASGNIDSASVKTGYSSVLNKYVLVVQKDLGGGNAGLYAYYIDPVTSSVQEHVILSSFSSGDSKNIDIDIDGRYLYLSYFSDAPYAAKTSFNVLKYDLSSNVILWIKHNVGNKYYLNAMGTGAIKYIKDINQVILLSGTWSFDSSNTFESYDYLYANRIDANNGNFLGRFVVSSNFYSASDYTMTADIAYDGLNKRFAIMYTSGSSEVRLKIYNSNSNSAIYNRNLYTTQNHKIKYIEDFVYNPSSQRYFLLYLNRSIYLSTQPNHFLKVFDNQGNLQIIKLLSQNYKARSYFYADLGVAQGGYVEVIYDGLFKMYDYLGNTIQRGLIIPYFITDAEGYYIATTGNGYQTLFVYLNNGKLYGRIMMPNKEFY